MAFDAFHDEFQVRSGFAYSCGNLLAATAVNPYNHVYFNPGGSGKTATIRKLIFTTGGSGVTIAAYVLNANPGFAAVPGGFAPRNRRLDLFGTASVLSVQGLVAATPANQGVLFQLPSVTGGFSQGLIIENKIVIPPGFGINFQFAAIATTDSLAVFWDEQ